MQYRLVADEWSINTEDWAIADEGVYVENPEFVYVKTDKEGKILFAIKIDGGIYYGAGVPQQVKDYIEDKISSLSLDEYEDIVAFLSDYLGSDTTLKVMIDGINDSISNLSNTKVDKEEGKSLIDAEYASSQSAIESPEFIEVTTDSEGKVLEGIQVDGTKVIGGDIKVLGNMKVSGVSYTIIKNPEYLAAWVDAENKVIFGLKADGKTYVGDADFLDEIKNNQEAIGEIKSYLANFNNLDIDALSSITTVYNPEFVEIKTDSEGKVLAGRTPDGAAFENVGFTTPKVSIDGHTIENFEDLEGRTEIITDSEGKIISYRDSDGVRHEEVGTETNNATVNHLNLTETGMTEFQQALKSAGFQPGGGGDASDRDYIELPEPKSYGLLNLIISELPNSSGSISEGYAEYYDFFGNSFKIACSVEPQGQTSKIFASTGGKGNYTLDLEKEVKFGTWVPQDSFHLKGCAKDCTRGILATSYKYAWKIMNALGAMPNRVLKKADSNITLTHASGDRFTDWPDDARCLPDGFPCELYVNGEYWGLYALQLKKHRKNYSMKKSDYTSFFLDADSFGMSYTNGAYKGGFWLGNIPWTGFEIKNPKDLICMDGSKYDGDNPKELIDSTSEHYNPSNSKHVGSAQTKAIIEAMSTKYLEVKSLIDNNDTIQAKSKFEEYFDYNACMFVYIYNCTMANGDSINKNTLWGVYKNGKIAPMLWDLDGMYGQGWTGLGAGSPGTGLWTGAYANSDWPLSLFWSLYENEIKDTYAELRDNGVLTIESWRECIYDMWVNRIGTEAYDRDIERWPGTPSYRKNLTNWNYWTELGQREGQGGLPLWDESTEYSANDEVVINMGYPNYYMRYKAVVSNTDICPVTGFYDGFPTVGGFYDSPKRFEKWMTEQINLCDETLNNN